VELTKTVILLRENAIVKIIILTATAKIDKEMMKMAVNQKILYVMEKEKYVKEDATKTNIVMRKGGVANVMKDFGSVMVIRRMAVNLKGNVKVVKMIQIVCKMSALHGI